MRLLAVLFSLFLTSSAAFAEQLSVHNDNTDATILVSHEAVKPGDEIIVGLLLQPKAGWHTYWQNPGDAGIPTTLTWTLPEDTNHSGILWPLPSRIPEDTLAVYGYKGDVLLPTKIRVPDIYKGEEFPIKVKAEWLVCEKICVPESAEFSLTLPVAKESKQSQYHEDLEKELRAIPKKLDIPLPTKVAPDGLEIMLPEEIAADGHIYFFPREQNHVAYAAPQQMKGHVLFVPLNGEATAPATLTGYLESKTGMYDVELAIDKFTSFAPTALPVASDAQTASAPPPAPPAKGFFGLILFAIIGGLILNLMPCVLPVLSLKALAIAKKSGHNRRVVVKQALAYTFGVLASFAIIAAILISLQMAGQSIGWGFQMQSAPFVGFLCILLFVVGLNFAGMFDLPVLFGSALSDTPQHGLRGSFATGVLATAVATPCTAPFMATAVGATLTLAPWMSMIIFLSIGLGLALPFLLIAIHPRLVAYLPKPGAWMESFKQFMAFPMFASVIWLLWVIVQQAGSKGLLITLVTILAISFIIWLKGRCRDASPLCRISILLLLAAALYNGVNALAMVQNAPPPLNHMDFSEERLQALRDTGQPVFVDVTAAWCLTCQVNARTAIMTPAAQAAFAETNTALMVADWTNRNDAITQFLKRFGYNGVPLYVYFPPSGEPVVLPQILTESLVIDTVKGETP
ncbi:MAG: protein-disulfide reductase DsbD family protein [Alphaproteobacteria bacterium]|nr:protein-disulfide reductase DsbD family protein [Alphaproteobacteria bacterium]